ncbi:MAG: homoserine dehydrogenase, partial [Rhizobiaceae bacterium]|nr:homoserine dehydrogenase [Rhizobiaceae bacterium]
MADALKIGVAGLGTVGASLVRIIHDRQESLAVSCGRAIDITAVSARSRDKDRGIDLSGATWFDDPVEMAKSGDIEVLVELIGGADGAARAAVEAA